MAHTDSERNWCQEPRWNKDKNPWNQSEMEQSGTAWRVTYACTHRNSPGHKEMLSPYQGDTHYHKSPTGCHMTTGYHLPGDHGHRWGLSSLAGVCEHLHVFTTFPWGQNRVILRKKVMFVCASSSSGNWRWVFSRQQAKSGLTYVGVVSIKLQEVGTYPIYGDAKGDTKPLPS